MRSIIHGHTVTVKEDSDIYGRIQFRKLFILRTYLV